MFLFHSFRNDFSRRMERQEGMFIKKSSFTRDFIAAMMADLMLHPLHLVEARYVLQNRLPNFISYKSLYSFGISSYAELHKGMFLHIPRNFILALSKVLG